MYNEKVKIVKGKNAEGEKKDNYVARLFFKLKKRIY